MMKLESDYGEKLNLKKKKPFLLQYNMDNTTQRATPLVHAAVKKIANISHSNLFSYSFHSRLPETIQNAVSEEF